MSSKRNESIHYEHLEPRLRTGDLFLFSGASHRSRLIEAATHSEFSHIAMVVRPDPAAAPLLWHTDPRPVTEDVEAKHEHGGTQLNELSAAMATMTSPEYGDTPYVRQLIVERTREFENAVLQAISAIDETPFPSLLKIVKEWVLGQLHLSTSGKRMYCAEVIATTYQRMGLLPAEPPANAYMPVTFSAKHASLPLLRGASLGPEIQVLWSQPGSEVR